MSPLVSWKQLLIAESELNRAQLVQDWQTMADEVHSLANQARTISSFASAAASLVAGVASFRRKKSAPAEKPSWWRTILKGAQLAGSFWSEFRSKGHDRTGI
jgi:HPt (histidine-containing phosphotransfer) domain-containing protein